MITTIIFSLLFFLGFIYLSSKISIPFSFENQNQKYKYSCNVTFSTNNNYLVTLYSDKNTYTEKDISCFLEKRKNGISFETTTHEKVFIKKPKVSEVSVTCSENLS